MRTIKKKLKVILSRKSNGIKKTKTIKLRPSDKNIKANILVKKMETVPLRLNESFIQTLSELADIMGRKGEQFRARAYKSAADELMRFPNDITNVKQIEGLQHIGKTITLKLNELQTTGKIQLLEDHRNDPMNKLTRVYGIGPKKAKELIEKGIESVEDLKSNQDFLTTNMKLGVQYFDDIESRIPRKEIDDYKKIFTDVFSNSTPSKNSSFEIVGSYRRGNKTSGDIDIIITNKDNKQKEVFDGFLDALIAQKYIVEVLTRGKTKSMTIARIPGHDGRARRVDFMYAPPDEYAFALLYFTGSKTFNTIQRQRALDMGYSMNEHGLYNMKNGVRGDKLTSQTFPTEESIFEFLKMEYCQPTNRRDMRCVRELEKTNQTINPIELFRKKGATALHYMNEEQLSKIIRDANANYYGNGTPIMTDQEYDMLCETTKNRFPNNEAIKEGHTKTNVEIEKNKVILPYEMWSMDKIKPDTKTLSKWKSSYGGPYVISCKLDGVSGLFSTECEAAKLYTRGNGKVGQDVSHLIPYLKMPVKKNTCPIVLRGEFIMEKEVFQDKYSDTFANPRNFVAGIVNQKKFEPEKFVDVKFVCYEVIKPIMKPSEQMMFLATNGFETVESINVLEPGDLSNDMLSKMLLDWRGNYKYESDGVICADDNIYPRVNGNPEHAFAFKMLLSEQTTQAKVVDVIWTPSKDGYLKPRVQIEPVVLGGVSIEYATGFNARFIYDKKVGVDSIVKLVRSGDVIPHIEDVVREAEQGKMPCMVETPYVWNKTKVDIMLQDKMCDAVVQEKNITGFFKTIEVEGLSSGNVKRIMDAGFDTTQKIIKMSKDDFLGIDGFKDKLATKISEGIKTKLDAATLPQIMQATNIFGRGFGVKRFGAILKSVPMNEMDKTPEDLVIRISNIPGMAQKTSKQFVTRLPVFKKWMKEAGLQKKYEETYIDVVTNNHPLYGKKYVITGFRDKNLVKKLESIGAIQMTTVSKNTDFVIVKTQSENSSKAAEARRLNIKLVTIDDFNN